MKDFYCDPEDMEREEECSISETKILSFFSFKDLRTHLSKNQCVLGSTKGLEVRSTSQTGPEGKEKMQNKETIWLAVA